MKMSDEGALQKLVLRNSEESRGCTPSSAAVALLSSVGSGEEARMRRTSKTGPEALPVVGEAAVELCCGC